MIGKPVPRIEERCTQRVTPRGMRSLIWRQCSRMAVEDGKCRLHTQAGIAARAAKRERTFDAKALVHQRNWTRAVEAVNLLRRARRYCPPTLVRKINQWLKEDT